MADHTWETCSLCGPMVRCGYCGNNCCNGGSGDGCPDNCFSAHAKQRAELHLHRDDVPPLAVSSEAP